MTTLRDAATCEWASCHLPATAESNGWAFCDRHAEQDRHLDDDELEAEEAPADLFPPEANGHGTGARAKQHYRDGEKPCEPCRRAANQARIDLERRRKTMTTPSPNASLLERAAAHHSPKVKRLGTRIEALYDDLRAALKACEAEEQARAEIARLEDELREAKARLKAGKPYLATDGRTEELVCRKGCGKVCHGGQGRAAHERGCTYGEATG